MVSFQQIALSFSSFNPRRGLNKGPVAEWEPEGPDPGAAVFDPDSALTNLPNQEGLPVKPVDDKKLDDPSTVGPPVDVNASPAEPSLLPTEEHIGKVITDGVVSPPIPFIQQTEVKEVAESKKLIFKSKREKWVFLAFIIPPLAISFISMLHMISLFETSNMYWMAVSIAVAVELAAMSSLVALVTLDKLNKTTIWSIFGVLASLQILGNMYHTFVNMSPESAQMILNLLALDSTPWSLRLVNFIVGGILPVIALTFVKGIVDYFKEE